MISAYLERRWFRLDWRCIQKNFYWIVAVLFAFAAGGWMVSIRVEEQNLPYLQSATNRFERVQRIAGPNPEATVRCLNRKADVAEDVAEIAKWDERMGAPSADLSSIPECPIAPASK